MADTVSSTVSSVDTDRFTVKVTSDSHFSWLRTRLSLERTMMSWLRTATALIAFGFAIVQFFERLQQTPEAHSADLPNAPIFLGLALIACGVLALVVAILEYRRGLRYLWDEPFTPIAGMAKKPMDTPVLAIGILLIFIGLFAFFAVLVRLG